MKNIEIGFGAQLILTSILIMLFPACNAPSESRHIPERLNTDVKGNTENKELTNNPDSVTIHHPEPEEATSLELNFIVNVAEGYNYDSLKLIALKTAEALQFKFDTMDRYYDPQRGIILPDTVSDEIWAGSYFFRRSHGDFVSLEMQYAYADTSMENNPPALEKLRSDTSKMFVFATMYPDKFRADSLAEVLKKKFPGTHVIASQIYMGCMH